MYIFLSILYQRITLKQEKKLDVDGQSTNYPYNRPGISINQFGSLVVRFFCSSYSLQ